MDDVRFEQVAYGPNFLGIVPAACAVALFAVVLFWARRQRPSLVRLLWVVPYLGILVAASVWYFLGLGTSDVMALLAFCGLVCCGGVLVLNPSQAAALLPKGNRTLRVGLGVVVLSTLALEFTWNEKWFTIGPQFWLVELLFVAGFQAVLWLLCGKRGGGPAVGAIILTVIGVLQHYVLEFRGTSILPSDVLAASTALSVSGGYAYGLSSEMLGGFFACLAAIGMASLLWPARNLDLADKTVRQVQGGMLKNCAIAGAIAVAMAALALVPSYATVFGADIDYWWSKDWYERQGFLPSFIYACQDLTITEPKGYSTQRAEQAQETLVSQNEQDEAVQQRRALSTRQFESSPPNIIVVQNETFCDLSNFNGLANGYVGPTFWNKGMLDSLMRGSFAVSVFGGGTCNTEFEFLTGNSLAFVGTAKYPFSMYDLTVSSSLPKQLGELGYSTVGMHPNLASNWNRDRAYEQLGFDKFLSMDDFAGAEEFHTHVSDWATYDRALDLVETTDEPVFVFDVTMQNHSGYDTGSVPKDMLPNYTIEGLSKDDTFQLNEYLACIEESDNAIERLVNRLKELKEPTVLVLYGDHHPWFSEQINDLLFANESDLDHAQRIHQTTYAVWANYQVDGWTSPAKQAAVDDTSADFLAAMTLDAVGAPLTKFQSAQLGARQEVRALNADGFLGNDGSWHSLGDVGAYEHTLEELALVEYLNFGSKV